MNYETYNEPTRDCHCASEPVTPLTELMRETSMIADSVLKQASGIGNHLFGAANLPCEKEIEPKCFKDELMKTRHTLMVATETLAKMASLLGM